MLGDGNFELTSRANPQIRARASMSLPSATARPDPITLGYGCLTDWLAAAGQRYHHRIDTSR
jgi:hypothetical protein